MNDDAPRRLRSAFRGSANIVGDLATVVVVFGLLGLVYLLPADTSLSQVQASGRVSVCMPTHFPPLVTRDPSKPGFDVELVAEIARRLDVRLAITSSTAMGRDFNPRSWRVTRAQCQLLAGGVVLSPSVRSFLETVPVPLSIGWAAVSADGLTTLEGQSVGFHAGLTGLDRIGLSRYLRQVGVRPRVVQSLEELEQGLRAGDFSVAITEELTARQLAGAEGWVAQQLPHGVERYQLGIGFWRGDVTLVQAVERILASLEHEGFIDALMEKYGIATLEDAVPR